MNSRRQTLAAMSPAALNSRPSLGPTRITKDSKASGKNAGLAAAPALAAGSRPPANNAPVRMAPGGSMQRRCCLFFHARSPEEALWRCWEACQENTESCFAARSPEGREQAGA